MSMYWRLAPSVTACLAADRIILLDIGRDRYSSLPQVLTADFLAWLGRPGSPPPEACARMLCDLRVNARDAAAAGFPAECSIAWASPIDSEPTPPCRIRARDLASVGRSVISAARDVRSRPLASVLECRLGGRTDQDHPAPGLNAKLAAFRATRPLVPVPRVCLHDCLALIDWLGASSAGVSLVFGVSAYPFTAHCWLQSGTDVLDDHPESPSRFEPILHFQ
jgi:hypothetical protein